MKKKIDEMTKKQTAYEKQVNNKVKDNKITENKITRELSELQELKTRLKQITDAKELAEIIKSQEFVSKKYDELLIETVQMKETFSTNINV